jgi:hypothetical protein
MNIHFETEGKTVFAVVYDHVIDDYRHEELLIAEIDEGLGSCFIRFESDWRNPIHCDNLDEAKQYIIKNHYKYKATSLGKNYYVGE